MWRNPKYPDPPRATTQAPPVETGERLATMDRGRGVELRVSLDHYEDRPYVSIRLWERNREGIWWPTKRGVTIRIRELGEVLAVLSRVAEVIGGEGPPGAGPGRDVHSVHAPSSGRAPTGGGDRRRQPAPPRAGRAAPDGQAAPFDEFG